MGRKCLVPTCKSTNENLTLHILPKDPEKRLLWLQALDLHHYADHFNKLKEFPRVCSEHFSDSSYDLRPKRFLKNDAVPQLQINKPTADGDDGVPRRIQNPVDDHKAQSGQETAGEPPNCIRELQNGTMRLSAGSFFPETPAFSLTQELMMDMHKLSGKIQKFYPDALGKQFTLTFQGEDGDKNDYIFTSASEKRRSGEHHNSLRCNECGFNIVGFRYKCMSCAEYDLCSACEALGIHADHLMMRIAKPIKLKRARTLLQQWCEAMKAAGISTAEEITQSQDDETQPEPPKPPSSSSKSLVIQITPIKPSLYKMTRENAINKGKTKAKKKPTSEEEQKDYAKKRKIETPDGDDTIEKVVGFKEEPIDDSYNSLNESEVILPTQEMRSDPDPLRTDKIKTEDMLTDPTSSSILLAEPGPAATTSEDPAIMFQTYTHTPTR